MQYFYDTYAMVEIIHGNPNFIPYLEAEGATTHLQLYEFYYTILRTYGEEKANIYFDIFKELKLACAEKTYKRAAKFKLKHKKRKLSYADCQGYVFAQELGIPFLTGDKEFENLENVEFVK